MRFIFGDNDHLLFDGLRRSCGVGSVRPKPLFFGLPALYRIQHRDVNIRSLLIVIKTVKELFFGYFVQAEYFVKHFLVNRRAIKLRIFIVYVTVNEITPFRNIPQYGFHLVLRQNSFWAPAGGHQKKAHR